MILIKYLTKKNECSNDQCLLHLSEKVMDTKKNPSVKRVLFCCEDEDNPLLNGIRGSAVIRC